MLASIFVFGGVNELRQAPAHAEAGKPLLDKVADRAPDALREGAPSDPATLVRIDGVVKVAAGTMFALGLAPRTAALALIGSLVPTTAAAHQFWATKDEDKQQQLVHFLKNVGLAGGLLIAAADTAGKPSLGWRARRAASRTGRQIRGTADTAREKLPA